MSAIVEKPSPNANDRPAGASIDMFVLHYTGMRTATAALDRLCDPAAQVSAHYLIDEDGTVYRLVAEEKRAWHAGVARWCEDPDVNGRSIGVELVNPGPEFIYRDFPQPQMESLTELAQDILKRHPIPGRNVVGHSDIAPDRKLDPGERFNWRLLATNGIGLWPQEPQPVDGNIRDLLVDYGYDVSTRNYVAAFQRHFRPSRVDGIVDDETRAQLGGLLAQLRGTA
jgi:N-acetylmuramoyl-L-alanine amidase